MAGFMDAAWRIGLCMRGIDDMEWYKPVGNQSVWRVCDVEREKGDEKTGILHEGVRHGYKHEDMGIRCGYEGWWYTWNIWNGLEKIWEMVSSERWNGLMDIEENGFVGWERKVAMRIEMGDGHVGCEGRPYIWNGFAGCTGYRHRVWGYFVWPPWKRKKPLKLMLRPSKNKPSINKGSLQCDLNEKVRQSAVSARWSNKGRNKETSTKRASVRT